MSQTCIFCVDAPELDFDFCRVCGRGLPENPCGEVISEQEHERVSARLAFIRASESPKTGNSCASHCCPVHGCKYAYDQPEWQEHEFAASGYVHRCPVSDGTVKPEYPENNGCEWCEMRREERAAAYKRPGCYVIEVDGEAQRIQGKETNDPETIAAIQAVIRAARNMLEEGDSA